jgi:hypothetical protein
LKNALNRVRKTAGLATPINYTRRMIKDAMTLSITTLNITTLSITSLSITSLSKTSLSIMTLSIAIKNVTLNIMTFIITAEHGYAECLLS